MQSDSSSAQAVLCSLSLWDQPALVESFYGVAWRLASEVSSDISTRDSRLISFNQEETIFFPGRNVIELRIHVGWTGGRSAAAVTNCRNRSINREARIKRERMIPTSTIGGPMEFTLRLIGVWPDSSCRFLLRVIWTTAMATSQLLQYWYLFSHIGSDTLLNLMDSMSLCLSNSLLFLKLSLLWLNGR